MNWNKMIKESGVECLEDFGNIVEAEIENNWRDIKYVIRFDIVYEPIQGFPWVECYWHIPSNICSTHNRDVVEGKLFDVM